MFLEWILPMSSIVRELKGNGLISWGIIFNMPDIFSLGRKIGRNLLEGLKSFGYVK